MALHTQAYICALHTLPRLFAQRGWALQAFSGEEQRARWDVLAAAEAPPARPTPNLARWIEEIQQERAGLVCLGRSQAAAAGTALPDVAVFIPREERLGVRTVRQVQSVAREMGWKTVLMLHPGHATPQALNEVARADFRIEQFLLEQLAFWLPDNEYVPPTERLAPAKAAEIKKRFGDASLPVLPLSDPHVQACGYAEGDVLKVVRSYKGLEPGKTYVRVSAL